MNHFASTSLTVFTATTALAAMPQIEAVRVGGRSLVTDRAAKALSKAHGGAMFQYHGEFRQRHQQSHRRDQGGAFVSDSFVDCASASLDLQPQPGGAADCQIDDAGSGLVCSFAFPLDEVAQHMEQCEANGGAAHVEFDDLALQCTVDFQGVTMDAAVTITNEIVCVSPDSLCDTHRDDFCSQWDDLQAILMEITLEDIQDISSASCVPLFGSDQCTITEFEIVPPTPSPSNNNPPPTGGSTDPISTDPIPTPAPTQSNPVAGPDIVVQSQESSGLSTGEIAGIAAGGAVLVAAVAALVAYCCCCKKEKKSTKQTEQSLFVTAPIPNNYKPRQHVPAPYAASESTSPPSPTGRRYIKDDDDDDDDDNSSGFGTIQPPPSSTQASSVSDPIQVNAVPVPSNSMPVVTRVSGGAVMVETKDIDANGSLVTQRRVFPTESAARNAGYYVQ